MFDDREYTRDSIIKQLGLIELHGKDGSALDSGCMCIETKHLFMLEALSEEGMGFAMTDKEKKFYQDLSSLARETRKNMEIENYILPKVRIGKKTASGISGLHGLINHDFRPSNCELEHPTLLANLQKCVETHSLKKCRQIHSCP